MQERFGQAYLSSFFWGNTMSKNAAISCQIKETYSVRFFLEKATIVIF